MNDAPVHLASDVHLGAISEENERAFLSWLQEVGAESSCLVLNGDLFDYWFEYRSAIPQGYTRALGALSEIVDAGVPVHLLGGNHDWWGGRYLEEEVGIRFHRDPLTLDLQGHRTHLAHGDGLGPGDTGYKILRTVLRSRIFRWAYRWTHPDVGAWIARRASSTHERGSPTEGEVRRAGILEEWAETYLRDHPSTDLVVLGHTHVPVLREVDPGRFYLNCGDWVFHRTFAVLHEGTPPRLMAWDASGDHRIVSP